MPDDRPVSPEERAAHSEGLALARADRDEALREDGIARAFHEAYERLAPRYGYKTRDESSVPWEDVPEDNRRLMRATVRDLLNQGTILAALSTPAGPGTGDARENAYQAGYATGRRDEREAAIKAAEARSALSPEGVTPDTQER